MRKWWKKNGKLVRRNLRFKILDFLGGRRCKKCGFSDFRALQVDHINGGGCRDLKQGLYKHGVWALYAFVKKHPGKFQVLCANCNWIKRWENKEFSDGKKLVIHKV